MSRIWLVAVCLALPAAAVNAASAAAPTTLTVTAPPTAGEGEEIPIRAALRTADGRPIPRAPLVLLQVGAVGERSMAQAVTDDSGAALFVPTESTIAHLSLRVRFAGDRDHAPAAAQTSVEISGIDVPPSVVMGHTPSPLVKGVLFALLGAVWLTYAFAATCILRIIGRRRGVVMRVH